MSSAAMQAQLHALRAENARLTSLVTAQSDAAAVAASAPASLGAPKKMFGEIKLWVGNWNMGACDPFLNLTDPATSAASAAKMLAPFIPLGLDVYVLGVQEGISEKVFDAVEAYTGCFRIPLHKKLYAPQPADRTTHRIGQAIRVQTLIDQKAAGETLELTANMSDMTDRVWGRGDGALLLPKYTGIAVFVAPVVAPYVRLLAVAKHSFGASEGSKGGVGVALGLYDVNVAFVNTHLASKRADMRRAQYQEIVDRLGTKLGSRGFGLNESFHHIVWVGDLNTHCKGVSAADAVELIRTGRHLQLLLAHDELLMEKEAGTSFWEYEEPLMAPRFFPTYKKLPGRGVVDTRDPAWPSKVYCTHYKEPIYKGGSVQERVPSWTDRIQYHSLPDRWGELLPESLDATRPEASPHNYQAVNDALDTSDHAPVYATFSLQISTDEVSEGVDDAALSRFVEAHVSPNGGMAVPRASLGSTRVPAGIMADADFAALHPSLRPLIVVLRIGSIVLDYGGVGMVPRAAVSLFPLPFEDSDGIPERQKTTRAAPMFAFGARSAASSSLAIGMRSTVSRAARLESLHLLLKVSLDDGSKPQCVIAMREGGFAGVGSHMNTFKQPLTLKGLPFRAPNGANIYVQFTLEMHSYERGGAQSGVPAGMGGGSMRLSGGGGGSGSSAGAAAAPSTTTAAAASAPTPTPSRAAATDSVAANLRSPSAAAPSTRSVSSYSDNVPSTPAFASTSASALVATESTPNELARIKAQQTIAAARTQMLVASRRGVGGAPL